MQTQLKDGTMIDLGEGVPAMKAVYVVNREENCAVFGCDTVQEAEEWLVEKVPEEQQDDITIEATDTALAVNEAIAADPEVTAVPDVPPINHLDRALNALSLLMTSVEDGHTGTDLQVSMTEANDVLETIWGGSEIYTEMPELREFDEIVSQGREAIIDWIEAGRPDIKLADPLRIMDDMRDDLRVPLPMRAEEASLLLQRRADGIVTAIGFGPASFAIPGLRGLLADIDFAAKVPVPELHDSSAHNDGDFAFHALDGVAITYEEFKALPAERRLISRASLQLVAS